MESLPGAVIAALLADSLARAAREADLAPLVARMTLIEGDSIEVMRALRTPPDVILLDPMFPERQKSGRIKKKLQLLQRLEEPCGEEAALLAAARALHPKKILIKRPAKGPHLAGAYPLEPYPHQKRTRCISHAPGPITIKL